MVVVAKASKNKTPKMHEANHKAAGPWEKPAKSPLVAAIPPKRQFLQI
jgi:hypothetical protein